MRTPAIMLYIHLLFLELHFVIHYYMEYLPKTCRNYKKYKTELPDFGLQSKLQRAYHPLLRELHSVCERIKFKLLTLAYKSRHETTPPYIQNLLKPHNYFDGNMFLCSHADDNLLVCNKTHTTYGDNTYGDNAFCNVVPDLWNKLPTLLRTSNSVATF